MFGKRISRKDLVAFTTGLGTLHRSGVPLLEALDGLQRACPSERLREAVEGITAHVEKGGSLAEALAEHPNIFDSFYLSMVAVGEATGQLDKVLDRLAEKIERDDDLNSQLKGAAAYPTFSLVVAGGVIVFILVAIVPRFVKTFADSNIPLPAPTRVVVELSSIVVDHAAILGVAAVALPLLLNFLARDPDVREVLDSVKLRLPLVGPLTQLVVLQRFSSSLQILNDSGVPILDSLDLLRGAVGNAVYGGVIDEMSEELTRGGRIADFILSRDDVFPAIVYQLVGAGEKSGNLGSTLGELARYFDKQIQRKLKVLISLVEPAMILLMAVSVGGIIVSLFMPMFDLVRGLAS